MENKRKRNEKNDESELKKTHNMAKVCNALYDISLGSYK